MFSVHTAPDKLKNATITGQFGFVSRKLEQGNHAITVTPVDFEKAPFSKRFPPR